MAPCFFYQKGRGAQKKMTLAVGYVCNGNTTLPKIIGTVVCSKPSLLTALVEIPFSSVGRDVAYNAVFSFEAGNRGISPAISIKSPAMNFQSMGFNVQK